VDGNDAKHDQAMALDAKKFAQVDVLGFMLGRFVARSHSSARRWSVAWSSPRHPTGRRRHAPLDARGNRCRRRAGIQPNGYLRVFFTSSAVSPQAGAETNDGSRREPKIATRPRLGKPDGPDTTPSATAHSRSRSVVLGADSLPHGAQSLQAENAL
jgi:hypothetical protein